jgi:ABC-type transport system involved in multi-copper enzyme maturation permease subunit
MTMRALLRSELVKVRSTRTSLGLLAAMVGLVLLLVLLYGLAVDSSELVKEEHQRVMLGLGLAGGFIAALIGVMSITTEFRHGTIRPTFVFTPRRGRVLAAKALVSVAVGAVFGLLTEALALGVGIGILHARGADVILSPRDLLGLALGSVAAAALLAALGVGVGAVLRNQVLGVLGFVVWFMVIENLVVNLVSGVGKFFPLAAADALSGVKGVDAQALTAPQGGLVLTGYVLVFFAAGLLVTRRSDVK